jgi:hypothetical protein
MAIHRKNREVLFLRDIVSGVPHANTAAARKTRWNRDEPTCPAWITAGEKMPTLGACNLRVHSVFLGEFMEARVGIEPYYGIKESVTY